MSCWVSYFINIYLCYTEIAYFGKDNTGQQFFKCSDEVDIAIGDFG